jgi:hypothetical protein
MAVMLPTPLATCGSSNSVGVVADQDRKETKGICLSLLKNKSIRSVLAIVPIQKASVLYFVTVQVTNGWLCPPGEVGRPVEERDLRLADARINDDVDNSILDTRRSTPFGPILGLSTHQCICKVLIHGSQPVPLIALIEQLIVTRAAFVPPHALLPVALAIGQWYVTGSRTRELQQDLVQKPRLFLQLVGA